MKNDGKNPEPTYLLERPRAGHVPNGEAVNAHWGAHLEPRSSGVWHRPHKWNWYRFLDDESRGAEVCAAGSCTCEGNWAGEFCEYSCGDHGVSDGISCTCDSGYTDYAGQACACNSGEYAGVSCDVPRCPRFGPGDGYGGSERHLGSASSAEACVVMVREREPTANGATYPVGGGTSCFAEFGMTHAGGTSWQTCMF